MEFDLLVPHLSALKNSNLSACRASSPSFLPSSTLFSLFPPPYSLPVTSSGPPAHQAQCRVLEIQRQHDCSPGTYFVVGEIGKSQAGMVRGDTSFHRDVPLSTVIAPRTGGQPRLRQVQNALTRPIFKSMPYV